MREILFRGKDLITLKWVYGVPVKVRTNCSDEHIEIVEKIEYETDLEYSTFVDSKTIKPETIGQYTGLKDKNGTKIFEGDILINDLGDKFLVELGFNDEHFYPVSKLKLPYKDCRIIIGNIYDNPELLEG